MTVTPTKLINDLVHRLDEAALSGRLVDNMAHFRMLINEALGVPRPKGDPYSVRNMSNRYKNAATEVEAVSEDIRHVGRKGLPEHWQSQAGLAASTVTTAFEYVSEQVSARFTKAGKELVVLADGISAAQATHENGLSLLFDARDALDRSGPLEQVKALAREGLRQMADAAHQDAETGRRAATELDKLASENRLAKLDTSDISHLEGVTLAYAAGPGGKRSDNEILTATEMERASRFMTRMGGEDEDTIQRLLHDAKSPAEAAYLMKALAAGHEVHEIQQFAERIHPHGDDRAWLREHLTPQVRGPGSSAETNPVSWREHADDSGTRTAAITTVVARAMHDPLYSLEITTGTDMGGQAHEGDTFRERLENAQNAVYDQQPGLDGFFNWGGLEDDERVNVADGWIGEHVGSSYERVELSTEQERRAVLPEIQHAVNSGMPVPVSVTGPDAAPQQALIIGEEGDRLQLYVASGHTRWVSDAEFVGSELAIGEPDHASQSGMQGHRNEARDVLLPTAPRTAQPG